jgi:exonuclease SbcC
MILYSVRVENYKGIRGPLELDFATDCPNLLEGPNGAGKSTLVEAVQRCLVEGHNTAGVCADTMRPRGTALTPSVSVVFGHAEAVYRISKTFLDAPKAMLEQKRPDGRYDAIATGKVADEKVRELLRSQATKAKDRPGERFGVFSILCAAQGEQHLPALSGNVLEDIRRMLGAQLAGDDGTAFEKMLEKRYAAVWTPGGKPKKGPLTEIQAKLVDAQSSLQTCLALMAQAAEKEDSAQRLRGRSEQTAAALRGLREQLDAVKPVAEQIVALRGRRAPAVSRLEAADAGYKQQRSELDRIIELTNLAKCCEESQPALALAETDAAGKRDTLALQTEAAHDIWEKATRPNPEIEKLETAIERALALAENWRELENVSHRIDHARTAAHRVAAVEARLVDINAPDSATWGRIQALARDLDEATVRVDALALRFEITAETGMAVNVITGEPGGATELKTDDTLLVRGDGEIAVRLPRVATLRLAGPAGDAAHWRGRRDQADATLGALMAPFQVANWQDLARRVQEREGLAAERVRAEAELSGALAQESLDSLLTEHDSLTAGRQTILADEPSWATKPPDVLEVRATVAALKKKAEAAQAQARLDWQTAVGLLAAAEAALSEATRTRSVNENRLADANQQLAPLLADGRSLADRQDRLAERRRERETAEDAFRAIEAALSTLPADAPERAEEIRQRIDTLEAEIQASREAYQQDEAAVRTILQQGPYSSLAIAEERVRQLEVEEQTERLRLDAIQRLKVAVDAAKEKALSGLAQPVEKRATELLERISGRPLARIRLGSGLEVESIHPEGCGGDAAMEEMSAGEQEQIHFATRLALAEVLAGQERQVLVLDDPLVNTDADKFGRALDLIDKNREHFQFIILTCHPGRYLELENAATRPMETSAGLTTTVGIGL